MTENVRPKLKMPAPGVTYREIYARHMRIEEAKQLLSAQMSAEKRSQAHTDRGVLLRVVQELTDRLEKAESGKDSASKRGRLESRRST